MNRALPALVSIGMCLAAACAAAGKRTAVACDLRAGDSVFVQSSAPVYRDCGVEKKVRLVSTNVNPEYRPATPRTGCVSAEAEFVVDTLGRVEMGSARILHATDQTLREGMLAMLPRLLYEPAMRDGRKVRQIATEKRTLNMMVVLVPAGTSPTPPSGAGRRPAPSC